MSNTEEKTSLPFCIENKMRFIQPLSIDFTFVLALISYQFILNEAVNKTEN